MKIKHIYWFAYFNMFSPSVRYRAKYPLDLLKEKFEITSSFIYPSYNPIKIFHFVITYFSILFFRKKDSLIVIQRVYTNFIYANVLKLLIKKEKISTLYDLDDAEYYDRTPKTINYFLKNCSSASVGSSAVKKYADQFNSDAFILTSPILKHNITKEKRNNLFTIGWIGDFGGSHKESMFHLFFPAITKLNFEIKLVILGITQDVHKKEIENYFNQIKVKVVIPSDIEWQNEMHVYSKVKEFDVGVCPLVDNEITKAKSAFKIKQYFSCGVPALGSDIGENAQFLKHGINGYICNTSEEFKNAIIKLNEMDDIQYSGLSANAKSSIHNFDMEYYCNTLIEHYK